MQDAFVWAQAHWDHIIEGLVALYALLSVIVMMTPTPKDDELLAAARRFVIRLAFLAPKDSPQTWSAPGTMPDHPDDDRAEPEDH